MSATGRPRLHRARAGPVELQLDGHDLVVPEQEVHPPAPDDGLALEVIAGLEAGVEEVAVEIVLERKLVVDRHGRPERCTRWIQRSIAVYKWRPARISARSQLTRGRT